MSKQDDNKAIVGRWFTEFWGKTVNLAVVDEIAAPNMLLKYSLHAPRRTITRASEETEIVTKGRHDPCVGIRAVPVGEAMVACVLADAFLRHRGQVGA